MKFKDFFVPKQIILAILLFAILIPIALWDSNTQVRVSFDDANIHINSDRYNMTVGYDQITSAELAALADPGEKVADGFDDDIIRTGVWTNDTWGEYYITADLDTSTCVVLHLDDGRTFVFSSKDDETTAQHFETLQSYLS